MKNIVKRSHPIAYLEHIFCYIRSILDKNCVISTVSVGDDMSGAVLYGLKKSAYCTLSHGVVTEID